MQATTIGLDLAKTVFQVHGVDSHGKVVLARQLRRGQVIAFFRKLAPCVVGMEACATAHYWARELATHGHTVRLMPASYVKAYVKRSKTDAADAAAICEAVTRPSMRFVPVKTEQQQAALMLHRGRDLLIRQRTQLINAVRAHLAEIGLVAATGVDGLKALLVFIRESADTSGCPSRCGRRCRRSSTSWRRLPPRSARWSAASRHSTVAARRAGAWRPFPVSA
jgi:transposase